MASLLELEGDENLSSSTSVSYRLVPWLSWDEWERVRESLFSDSPLSIASALHRVSTWRSRGCLPVVVDVTASIIEIQQKDPFFRKDSLPDDAIQSEQMLAMLYCMAILRLVNCVVEKTRKRSEVSIAEAANAIGIPRTLIDIRHEGSHRDLPALPLVRDSAIKALHWLKSYYWEPQMKQIQFQKDGPGNIRKEIKSKLCELVSCLKFKQSSQHGSSVIKGKRGKNFEQLHGRNKLLSLLACKIHSSKSGGVKKQITKMLKSLVHLYSSFTSELISVLLELLLKALDSLPSEIQKDCQVGQECTLLDDWTILITKLSNRESELIPMLLRAVLNKIETLESMKFENGTLLTSSYYGTRTGQVEYLSFLFGWLVKQLETLKTRRRKNTDAEIKVSSTGANVPNTILMEILRKCILLSSYGNRMLMNSGLNLAQLVGDVSLMEKLNKLSLLNFSIPDFAKETSSIMSTGNFLISHTEAIHEGIKKLELVKLHRTRGEVPKPTNDNQESSGRWVAAKSWNPCPIGMLPRDLGSSGCLPVLDCEDNEKRLTDSSQRKQNWELKQCTETREHSCDGHMFDKPSTEKKSSKREASTDIYNLFDGSNVKKMRETVENSSSDDSNVSSSGVKGCLMIDGVWRKIREEELLAIKSGIRILL